MRATQRVCCQICVKLCFYLILEFLRFLLCKEGTKKHTGCRAGRRGRRPLQIPRRAQRAFPHGGEVAERSDGRWGFARLPSPALLRVSCGPGMPGPYGRWPDAGLLPGRADMESAPTEGIGRKGNNNEVPRASNARPYIGPVIRQNKNTACPCGQAVSLYQVI